jgi:hypothetical protein
MCGGSAGQLVTGRATYLRPGLERRGRYQDQDKKDVGSAWTFSQELAHVTDDNNMGPLGIIIHRAGRPRQTNNPGPRASEIGFQKSERFGQARCL